MTRPASRPLYHGLYTNAFGRRGEGFRHLFLVPETWPATDKQRIGHWLQGLEPLGEGKGAAMNCFRVGRTVHACLARVDGGFARDEHGRGGGVLVHAMLTPLAEGAPLDDFGRALLHRFAELERPRVADVERLEAYLEACRARLDLSPPAVELRAFLDLGDRFLVHFFDLVAARPQGLEVELPAASESRLIEQLTLAGALLPPRLRLACRWGVGLRTAAGLSFLAKATSDERATAATAAALPRVGAVYLRWLRQRVIGGASSPARAVVDDWNLRSWNDLARVISMSVQEPR